MASLNFSYTTPLNIFHSNKTVFLENRNRKSDKKVLSTITNHKDPQNSKPKNNGNNDNLNRRNVLIKLGTVYGANSILSGCPTGLAAPVEADVANCGPTDFPRGGPVGLDCCPPTPQNIIDFKLEKNPVIKVRPAAHLVDKKYVEKYERAIALMKALPEDDPRNFIQQANVHCAYCDLSYHQLGFPDLEYQVHGNWLFYAFHRCYNYFFERILSKLIDDPTFALPFWNWDHPDGMYMPSIYTNPNSPLYDVFRDQSHLPPTLMDLSFDSPDANDGLTGDELIEANLKLMYRQMVSNGKTPTMFFGRPYRLGDEIPMGGGSLEAVPHGTVHRWTGDPTQEPFRIDMGTFFAAARDPIFYAHHGNLDRLWSIWKTLGGNRRDLTDPDYLNASFFFYDENANPVRIRVRDVLDDYKLGYVYQEVDLPWLNYRPRPRISNTKTASTASETDTVVFPKSFNNPIKTKVMRTRKSRSKEEKKAEEEVLVIKLNMSNMQEFHKFDVYVNEMDSNLSRRTRLNTEFIGSYSMMPTRRSHMMSTTYTLGLTDVIDDLGVDDHDSLEVTLVPRSGLDSMEITDVHTDFMSS